MNLIRQKIKNKDLIHLRLEMYENNSGPTMLNVLIRESETEKTPFSVLVVGFAFHACLLLVLVTWRPTGDDPALFHVISAAWGVCNSIWETLIYSKSLFDLCSTRTSDPSKRC